MKITRRQFVQSSLLAGAGFMLVPAKNVSSETKASFFGVNPFILQNPDSVFIMKTDVDLKTNSQAIRAAGLAFGRSVFGLTDNPDEGIPLTHKVVIKPNLTCRARGNSMYTIERTMGIVTDAFFVEGIIESMKELSIEAGQFYIREVNCPDDLADGGYLAMAERTGIDLKGIDTPAANLSPSQIQWVDVPKGVWFKKIPYLWPVNAPETFLLNIAKFKAHSMGLTLCSKNLQGTIAGNYQAHCTSYGNSMTGVSPDHINPSANEKILASYNRHVAEKIPRWKRPGSEGGIWQETWATRCLDNNSVTFAGLHIIEGIYGRDGNFLVGPGPQDLATDYMSNYIIFGRNQFYVDIIGHWLGGHEPGNFGLFHMARERGMITTINPMDIPVYEWDPDTGPSMSDLTSFVRYPLLTCYLQRNYDGMAEPYWHLVNEPYNYAATDIDSLPSDPDSFYLKQNFPNPVRSTTSLTFNIPGNGHVTAEILGTNGELVERLVNEQFTPGEHTLTWSSRKHPSGLYICRINYGSYSRSIKMVVFH
jgi:hypothetical protein